MKQTADVFLLLHYLVHCDAVYTDVILPAQVYVTKMGKRAKQLSLAILVAYELHASGVTCRVRRLSGRT